MSKTESSLSAEKLLLISNSCSNGDLQKPTPVYSASGEKNDLVSVVQTCATSISSSQGQQAVSS